MFQPVAFLESLLLVLMVTIAFRSFLPLRKDRQFVGGLFIAISLALFLMKAFLPGWAYCIGGFLAVWSYLLYLFKSQKTLCLGLLGGILLIYVLLCLGFYILLDGSGMLLSLNRSLGILLTKLLSQLFFYMGLFIASALWHRRQYPVTCYFPLIPSLITLGLILSLRDIALSQEGRFLFAVFLFVLIAIDFSCLVVQSWILASLHTRTRLKVEQVQRQYLENKYETLQQQYEKSFGFLHGLLRDCCDLHQELESRNWQGILEKNQKIAGQAFIQFNEVCISSPCLNQQLQLRRDLLEKSSILVSTAIRNDQFGLMTFEEQNLLFSLLLDYCLPRITEYRQGVRFLAIKSAAFDKDIVMHWIFPDGSGSDQEEFKLLQKKLSRHFHAGLKARQEPHTKHTTLTLAMPLIYRQLLEELSAFAEDPKKQPLP